MSYDIAFKGLFLYPSARAATQALAELSEYEEVDDSAVTKTDLEVAGDRLRVECFTSAPASMWESSCGAIEVLSETAIGGHVNAQYDPGDGEPAILRIRFLPCGDSEELETPFPDGIDPIAAAVAAAPDADLDHALVTAAMSGDEAEVRALLARGAATGAGLFYGVRDPRILAVLLAHGLVAAGDAARSYSPLCAAARGGNAAAIRLLVAAGAATDETDTPSHATPLMLAASGMHIAAVATLLELGADPNARDATGNTPLMYTVTLGNDEVLPIALALRDAGAAVEDYNAAGETVWARARARVSASVLGALERQLRR